MCDMEEKEVRADLEAKIKEIVDDMVSSVKNRTGCLISSGSGVLDVRGGATLRQIREMAGRAMLDGPHDYATEELEGPLLDLAVAKAVGLGAVIHKVDNAIAPFFECCVLNECGRLQYQYTPSRGWCQGGPLVEEHRISLTERGDKWAADVRGGWVIESATPLLAAMRALVARKLGATVRM